MRKHRKHEMRSNITVIFVTFYWADILYHLVYVYYVIYSSESFCEHGTNSPNLQAERDKVTVIKGRAGQPQPYFHNARQSRVAHNLCSDVILM